MLTYLTPSIMFFILLGLFTVLVIWIIRLEMRLRKFLSGKDGKTLEDAILDLKKTVEDLSHFRDDSIEYFKSIEKRLTRSVQTVETLRFNPFKGTGSGGNQSFSTAILSEKGDGVVVSGMHYRDHVSMFSKPIKKFSSEFELTDEEKQVIKNSRDSLSAS